MFHTNLLIDALDRLEACAGDNDRWAAGIDLLSACGSAWLTAGTAPSDRLAHVSVRTSTPAALMRDYLGAGIGRGDPWMQHCATSSAIDACVIRPTATDRRTGPVTVATAALAALFDGHGVHRAVLLPCYGGARPGGIVLYACSAEAADWLSRPEGLMQARLLTALLASRYRPDDDRTAHADCYSLLTTLTARETEVLLWLAQGLQTARIAERLGIQPVTVSKHLAACCRKLKARTREQALAIALSDRLIDL